MLSRKTFNKLSNSLKWGFFSDEIVLILSVFKETGSIDSDEKKLLLKAKKFLEDAIKGHDWMEKNTFDRSKSAYAFSQAAKVLSHLETSENFLKHMQCLIQTTNSINDDKETKNKDIELLISFFTHYGKNQLEITENIVNRGGEYDQWQLMKAL